MSRQSIFASALLAEARKEAKDKGIELPKRMVALKVGRQQWAVQADYPHNFDHYVSASSASEAKARWISQLIEAAAPAAAADPHDDDDIECRCPDCSLTRRRHAENAEIDRILMARERPTLEQLRNEMEASRCTECRCSNYQHYEGCTQGGAR